MQVNSPKELILYQTSLCNLQCKFCSRQKGNLPKVKDIDVDIVKYTLNKYKSIQSVCIAGFGEPLLSKNIFQILEYLNLTNLYFSIITNGTLLKNNIDNLYKYRLGYISVSLNCSDKDEYKNNVGFDFFDSVLEGIKLAKYKGMNIGVSFVISTENVYKMEDYIKLGKQLGSNFIHLHNILPHSNNKEEFDLLVLKENTQESKYIEELKDKYSDPIISFPKMYMNYFIPKCNSPEVVLGIDGEGNITGCRRVNGPSSMNGNIYESNPFNSIYYKNLIENKNIKKDKCGFCFGNMYE